MKKIFFLLFSISTIVFLSCSKTYKQRHRLDGTWQITHVAGNYKNNGTSIPFDTINVGTISFSLLGNKNTGVFSFNFPYKDNGVYKSIDEKETITWDNTGTTVTWTYTDNHNPPFTWDVLNGDAEIQEWKGNYTVFGNGVLEFSSFKLEKK